MSIKADPRSAIELGVIGDEQEREIASKTEVRHNEALGIDQIVVAGQAVPPDLVGAEVVESEVQTEPKAKTSRGKAKADADADADNK